MSQGHLQRLDLSALHTTRLSRDDVYRSLSSRDDVYGSLECTMYTIQCISTHSTQFSSLYTTPLPRDLYAPYTHKIIIINSSQQTLHNIHSIQLSIHQLHVQSDLKRPCIVHIQLYISKRCKRLEFIKNYLRSLFKINNVLWDNTFYNHSTMEQQGLEIEHQFVQYQLDRFTHQRPYSKLMS